jgi:hypothetical protein
VNFKFYYIPLVIYYKLMINGIKTFAIRKPPTIKLIVAISEGNCSVDKPIIECPEVQPPAYLVPNPTRKPPPTINTKPLSVIRLLNEKISPGTRFDKSVMP